MTQGNEDKIGDVIHDDHTHSISGHRPSQGGPGALLISAGLLLWVGAGALMCVPSLMPQYAWVFKHAAKHGITSGPLLLCGLCLCGLGVVARALRVRKDEQEESQQRLRFDQLESGLAFVREGTDAARSEMSRVQEVAQSILQIAQSEQANAASQNRQDAIFRLAASLDQVGAHLDQRMQVQQSAMQAILEELKQSIAATQEQMKELALAKPPGALPGHIVGRAIEMRIAQGKGSTAVERSAQASGMISGSEGSLGLLDTLDDFGAMHSPDTSGRMQSSAEGHLAREHSDTEGPSAPLPREGAGSDPANRSSRRAPNGVHEPLSFESSGEISTRDKLELLRALMDDARVREALGGLTGVES